MTLECRCSRLTCLCPEQVVVVATSDAHLARKAAMKLDLQP